jgi:tetratricopeptide (TPR) repeat protein
VRAAPRKEYAYVEDEMFFTRLRRQAKWMFVFLALVFAVGFVGFGIGGSGTGGFVDFLENPGGSSSGPSVSGAQDKIDDGNLAAYKELAEAYRAEGKQEEAITAGEAYVRARPNDYEFMRSLASDYEGKAAREFEEATVIQEQLSTATGTTFAVPPDSTLGRALGMGRIDQELTSDANQKLTELYGSIESSYSRTTELLQRVARVENEDVLLQMRLGQAASQSRQNGIAINAYQRVCKLAPGSLDCDQARAAIAQLRAQAVSGPPGSG